MKIFKHLFIFSAFCLISILCLFSEVLNNDLAFAEGTEFNVSIEPSIELIIPEDFDLTVVPKPEGEFSSKSFDITVGSNNPTGYTLLMSNSGSDLVNTTSSSTVIPTLESNVAKASFPVNRWGYSLDDNTYRPIVVNSETTLKATETYDSSNPYDIVTLNLAANVNLDKPTGTYSNTFVFTTIANQSIFTITWNPGEGTVSPTTTEYLYGSKLGTLPTPTRTGYDFIGWFTQAEGGEGVTVETIVTTDATYYAHYTKSIITFDKAFSAAGKAKYGDTDYYAMQDMTTEICNAVTKPTTITEDISSRLIDARDNKIYWVSKLLDDNCWMTQNLDLDLNDSTLPLTPSTSDIQSDWNISSTYYTKNEASSSSSIMDTYSWSLGNYYWTGSSWTSCNSSTSYDTCVTEGGNISAIAPANAGEHYHMGNLYQWNTATAGTGGSIAEQDATGSICPKGWVLPTADSSIIKHSFGDLITAYNINSGITIVSSPLFFVPAGVISGRLISAGEYGNYWTSMADDSHVGAGKLSFSSSSAQLSYSNWKNYGSSVRCVAR